MNGTLDELVVAAGDINPAVPPAEVSAALAELFKRVVGENAKLRRISLRGISVTGDIAQAFARLFFVYEALDSVEVLADSLTDTELTQMVGAIPYFSKLTAFTVATLSGVPAAETLEKALAAATRAKTLQAVRMLTGQGYHALMSNTSPEAKRQMDLLTEMQGVLAPRNNADASDMTLVVDGPVQAGAPAPPPPSSSSSFPAYPAVPPATTDLASDSGSAPPDRSQYQPPAQQSSQQSSQPPQRSQMLEQQYNPQPYRSTEYRQPIKPEQPSLIARLCCCVAAPKEVPWEQLSPRTQFAKHRASRNNLSA